MSVLQAIILGIVEGITEFLPVSSTAHLILTADAMRLTGSDFLKSFEIIIQLGAILSVVVLYWKKFFNWEVLLKLAVAFIPTGVIGLALYKVVKSMLGSVDGVLATLAAGGVVIVLYERFKHRDEIAGSTGDIQEITYRKAFLVGLCQAVSIVPGVSRSAATIIGGSLLGISKQAIVEFSFLLAVPTMLAATGLELVKNYSSLSGNGGTLAVGFVVSLVTAVVAIKSFLAFVRKHDFTVFGWYRIVLAIAFYLVVLR